MLIAISADSETSAVAEFDSYVDLSNDEIRALNLQDSEEMLKILAEKEAMLNRRVSYPSSYSVSVNWEQQKNSYYCGPATATIILDCTSTPTTQEEIAGSKYLRTTTSGTPWFSGGAGMETADTKYYNMMYGLNQWQYNQKGSREWTYAVYPYNGETVTASGYFDRIKGTTYMDYPVAIFVVSNSTNKFNSNYPNSSIRHWVVCNGWSGNNIRICDPASGISGFTSVSKTYSVSYTKLILALLGE